MIACKSPRCCECAKPFRVVEPFRGGVWQHLCCDGCGVHLHVRRYGTAETDAWLVKTAAEQKGQRTAPLPAIGEQNRLRAGFFAAAARVGAMLGAIGVEPGMASIGAED